MYDLYQNEVVKAERALSKYQQIECSQHSSNKTAKLEKLEKRLADAKEALFCYLNDC